MEGVDGKNSHDPDHDLGPDPQNEKRLYPPPEGAGGWGWAFFWCLDFLEVEAPDSEVEGRFIPDGFCTRAAETEACICSSLSACDTSLIRPPNRRGELRGGRAERLLGGR